MTEIPKGMYLVMKNRSNYYKLLSEFFKHPVQKELLEGLQRETFKEVTENQFDTYPELEEGINLVHNFVQEAETEGLIEQINQDYEKIFEETFSPRESNHREMNKSETDDLLDELNDLYKRNEFDYQEGFGEVQRDHFAVESSFMLHLIIETRKEIINRNSEKVRELFFCSLDFFDDHIVNWFPSFATKVDKRSSTDFYKGAASLIKSFVKIDKNVFPMFLEKFESGK
ncbi:hypothetical protein C9439_00445 [archaeon SCG-AAA382B04]|nr:hypothetical protein C9439_00445 [archaeon SCG-AAA382B04]